LSKLPAQAETTNTVQNDSISRQSDALGTEAIEVSSESIEIDFRVSPYIGAGAAISTSDEGAVDFLATGGVDVPINDRFTANAAVNATLFDNAFDYRCCLYWNLALESKSR
jgi:hypothetical protein